MSEIDSFEFEHKGRKFLARVYADDQGAPWDNECGHGRVSDWERRNKRPGEWVLINDGSHKRFYDAQEAMAIAKRDGWGPAFYRVDIQKGANGLVKAHGRHFKGRELETFESEWCDDINAAHAQIRAAFKASMTRGEYAALAVKQDFERLRAWCNNDWQYVGISVVLMPDYSAAIEALRESGHEDAADALEDLQDDAPDENYANALWGIESDSPDYHADVARELADDILNG